MMKQAVIAASMVLALLVGSSIAPAAQQVTVVLKSGERITGELASFDKTTVDIRGSSGNRSSIPVDDIVVIDFQGGSRDVYAERQGTSDSEDMVVLRGGDALHGRVVDFVREGGEDAAVIFESNERGRQQLRLTGVDRIYIGRNDQTARASTPMTDEARPSVESYGTYERQITLPANTRWLDTGLVVRRGEPVRFESSGRIYLMLNQQDEATPAGAVSGRRANGAPIPDAAAGALIGRIGENGPPFGIGDQETIPMPDSGRLYLGINDDMLNDNSGALRVRITRPQANTSRYR